MMELLLPVLGCGGGFATVVRDFDSPAGFG